MSPNLNIRRLEVSKPKYSEVRGLSLNIRRLEVCKTKYSEVRGFQTEIF